MLSTGPTPSSFCTVHAQEALWRAFWSLQHFLCLCRLLQHAPRLLHLCDLHLQEEGEDEDQAVLVLSLPGQDVWGGRPAPH